MNNQQQPKPNGRSQAGVAASFAITPSQRSANIRYAIRDIVTLANQAKAAGKELLYLNIGDPLLFDFPTPRHVIDATYQAMLAGHNGYAPSEGVDQAVAAIRREAARLGIRNVQDVYITSGVSEGIEIALAALLNPGENVLIPSPGYPLYDATLAKLGYEAIPYPLDEKNGWQPDVSAIRRLITGKTRGIVVINPHNPTGAVCHRQILKEILDLAAHNGLVAFSDEIYSKLLLDPVDWVPLASLAPEQPILTLDGMSKAYLVPGFRVGWGILSGEERDVAEYREAIAKMLRVRLCANHPAQYAIGPALEGDQAHVKETVAKLKARRDLIVSLLNEIPGITCSRPQAAFYAFPRLEIARSDQEFVSDLIRQTGVLVVPGNGFGQAPGTKHFRLVFLPPEQTLRKAIHLIGDFAKTWR